jgi:hypothetical protein
MSSYTLDGWIRTSNLGLGAAGNAEPNGRIRRTGFAMAHPRLSGRRTKARAQNVLPAYGWEKHFVLNTLMNRELIANLGNKGTLFSV